MSEAGRTANQPTALVVIDVQVDMVEPADPEFRPHQIDAVLDQINVLLANARSSGSKVIFVRHLEPNYEPMRPGHPGFEVHPAIAPIEGETVINKLACDSFCDTGLEEMLRDSGVQHVALCGMQTDLCVDSTSRSALHRKFNVTLAKDAHTTIDNGVLTAEQIIAHHNATLAGVPGPGTRIYTKPSTEIEFAQAG
jgi:nicotinamidase-related amidase